MSIIVKENTINAKSIDLEFTDNIFEPNDRFKVIDVDGNEYFNTPIIKNETYVDEANIVRTTSIATLLFDDINLLEFEKDYTVSLLRDTNVIFIGTFAYKDVVSIVDATVTCSGTHSFTLNFDYPVDVKSSEDILEDTRDVMETSNTVIIDEANLTIKSTDTDLDPVESARDVLVAFGINQITIENYYKTLPTDPDFDSYKAAYTNAYNDAFNEEGIRNYVITTPNSKSPLCLLPGKLVSSSGNFNINIADDYFWDSSADLKSINIESKFYSFGPDSITFHVNYPPRKEAGFTNWIKEFETGKSLSSTIVATGEILKPSPEQTAVCNFERHYNSKSAFIATFCNPVLFMTQEIILTISGGPLVTPITLEGKLVESNDPTKAFFKMNTDEKLSPGIYNIAIPSITDANGNPTKAFNSILAIDDVEPEVISASASTALTIDVAYNTLMNEINDSTDPDFIYSSLNSNNYTLTALDGTPYTGEILDVISSTVSDITTVELKLSKPLSFGNYEVKVSNALSAYNLPLIIDRANFLFKDTSETTVTIIGYGKEKEATLFNDENQKVIVKYSKAMNIMPTFNAANDPINFGFIIGTPIPDTNPNLLAPTSTIVNISKMYQNRFRVPLSVTPTIPDPTLDDLHLYVGYNYFDGSENIQRRVSSTSGSDVQILNAGRTINLYAWKMLFCDETFAKMSLILPNQILYSYNESGNNNEFFEVISENLKFTLTGGIPIDEEIILDMNKKPEITSDGKGILFTFTKPINQDATNIIIEQTQDGDIKDFFGNAVTMENNICTLSLERDKVLPIIKSASIVSMGDRSTATDAPNDVKIALFFNKRMKFTADDNFLVNDSRYNNYQLPSARILSTSPNFIEREIPNPPFTGKYRYVPVSADLSIIELATTMPTVLTSKLASNSILISNPLDIEQMDTEDIHGNLLAPTAAYEVSNILSTSFDITLTDSDNNTTSDSIDAQFKLSFAKALNTTWFDEFDFGVADDDGIYRTFRAESKASYVDINGDYVEIKNGATVPANTNVLQEFKLYAPKDLPDISYVGNDIPEDIVEYRIGSDNNTMDDPDYSIGDIFFNASQTEMVTVVDMYADPSTPGRSLRDVIVVTSKDVTEVPYTGTAPSTGDIIVVSVNGVEYRDYVTDGGSTPGKYNAKRGRIYKGIALEATTDNPIPDVGPVNYSLKLDEGSSYGYCRPNPDTGTSTERYILVNNRIRFYLGTITIKYFTRSSITPNMDIRENVEVSFSDDNKALTMVIPEADTKELVQNIIIGTSYCQPIPFILMVEETMEFVNVSSRTTEISPTGLFTPKE